MTVTITWDTDEPLTGQPDAGSASKVYTAPGSGTVTITDEAIGGESVTLNYTVPLSLTEVVPTPDTVDSAGDAAARTITVAGEGFGANTAGTVAVATGAPGAYGTTVVSTAAMTNASGVFTAVSLTIPSDLDAGDYHIEATFGPVADLSAALTVTNTELVAPTGLASPAQTAGTVDLTWTAVPGAEEYVVRWAPSGTENWNALDPVTETSVTVPGLEAETSYDFQVQALAAGSSPSPWSETFTQATTAQPQLAAPANPAAGTPTATEIPLSWDAVAEAETYTVSWRTSPEGPWTDIPGVETTSHTVTGLDPNTPYDLRVKAVADGYTDSDWSTTVTETTTALGALTAPTDLASPAQTATSIDLTWTADANAEEHVVQWAPTGTTDWTPLAPVTDPEATVGGLTASTTYDIQVMSSATDYTDSPWSATFTQATTAA